MTPLIQCKNLVFSVGGPLLIDQANFTINPQERIGLVGRNGTGKSTLLKLLLGEHQADDGEITRQSHLKIGQLIQNIPNTIDDTIATVIASGHLTHGDILADYFRQYSGELSESVQTAMTEHDLWGDANAAQTLISKFNLSADTPFQSLSGGMKRRVLLAQGLVNNPELLLLDEPTNHLDISTIQWLEQFLVKSSFAQIIVSHDRTFLNSICNRILEIDRGQIVSWTGNYDNYVKAKAKALEEEQRHAAHFDKKLAEEEAWIRQGIKARRTRNEGRVRALKAMREQRKARREQQGKASFGLNQDNKSGKRVIEAEAVNFSFQNKTIIKDFTVNIVRGDKIGIIGDNGCGKSTLIKLLTGHLTPDSGNIKIGTQLDIAYLDQLRSDINEDQSVLDNISGGVSEVVINGKPRHIMSYAQDFLFSPAKARGPVHALSGGERNRLMLAKLFTKPCNFLILDEPTNDLDMETLELLESLLVDFEGTLLLVSHDRSFLNNVVSSTLAFEGNGVINEYVGGYDDWLRQRPKTVVASEKTSTKSISDAPKTPAKPAAAKKLSYKDQRELDQLPQKIEELETKLAEQLAAMNEPSFYQQDPESIAEAGKQTKAWQEELDHCYARWEALE
ncbi:MAG: ATP-binding cassette domain-containing protein [Arenicella sp.]